MPEWLKLWETLDMPVTLAVIAALLYALREWDKRRASREAVQQKLLHEMVKEAQKEREAHVVAWRELVEKNMNILGDLTGAMNGITIQLKETGRQSAAQADRNYEAINQTRLLVERSRGRYAGGSGGEGASS